MSTTQKIIINCADLEPVDPENIVTGPEHLSYSAEMAGRPVEIIIANVSVEAKQQLISTLDTMSNMQFRRGNIQSTIAQLVPEAQVGLAAKLLQKQQEQMQGLPVERQLFEAYKLSTQASALEFVRTEDGKQIEIPKDFLELARELERNVFSAINIDPNDTLPMEAEMMRRVKAQGKEIVQQYIKWNALKRLVQNQHSNFALYEQLKKHMDEIELLRMLKEITDELEQLDYITKKT